MLPAVQEKGWLQAARSVTLGELKESQERLRSRQVSGEEGVPQLFKAGVVISHNRDDIWKLLQEQGCGVTDVAAKLIEHPDFTTEEEGVMSFGRGQFSLQLARTHGVICPPAAAPPLLLAAFRDVEPAQGCYLLHEPIVIDGNPHLFYLSGNGPTLRAYPLYPKGSELLFRDSIVRIRL